MNAILGAVWNYLEQRKFVLIAVVIMYCSFKYLFKSDRSVEKNLAAGKKFLEDKLNEDGVVKLESGLMYKVIKATTIPDARSPSVDTECDCHYSGTLIDGTEFDSSFKRGKPATFAPNGVIKGWTEAMQLMREGDHWELYIPSELAYGDRQRGAHIYAGAALIFELQMISVKA